MDSVGRALRVAHVLEGSVRKSGDRVRITAQVIDARKGFHLWSQTYDRSVKDVFAVQDGISKAIVEQLRLKLALGEQLARQETTNPEAHTLVLKGIAAYRQGSRESVAEAERLFRQAIDRDPEYARAHALLGSMLVLRTTRRDTRWRRATRMLEPPPSGRSHSIPICRRRTLSWAALVVPSANIPSEIQRENAVQALWYFSRVAKFSTHWADPEAEDLYLETPDLWHSRGFPSGCLRHRRRCCRGVADGRYAACCPAGIRTGGRIGGSSVPRSGGVPPTSG